MSAPKLFLDLIHADAMPKRDPIMTILVVDADAAVRESVVAILENNGYNVIEAGSGESGLYQFDKHSSEVRLILTGMIMPGMSGIEMVKRILGSAPATRVVFMAAGQDPIPTEIDPRDHTILPKPFTPETLVKTVQECLSDSPTMNTWFAQARIWSRRVDKRMPVRTLRGLGSDRGTGSSSA